MSHLIRKTVFDTAYYLPGKAVAMQVEDTIKNGLILDADEEELTLAVLQDVIVDDVLEQEVKSCHVNVSDVESGDISVDRLGMESPQSESAQVMLKEIYKAYSELSNRLAEQEQLLSERNGVDDYSDISQRHENRMKNFKKLLAV